VIENLAGKEFSSITAVTWFASILDLGWPACGEYEFIKRSQT